jgi:hypothetical protein
MIEVWGLEGGSVIAWEQIGIESRGREAFDFFYKKVAKI